ncbi:MAG: hypothetical protein IKY97_07045 [Mailhella sp.]|nr:hypothetical protein [Mailhella sp.]
MKQRTSIFIPESRGELSLPSDSERLKKMFRAHIPQDSDTSWLPPLSFSLNESSCLTVHLPHELFFRWFSSNGRLILEKAVRETAGSLEVLYDWPGNTTPVRSCLSSEHSQKSSSSRATFENFIPGGKNKEVLYLLRRSLHAQPCSILLHGPSGTGKSHLLLAAFSILNERFPGKTLFLSGRELIALFRRSSEQAHETLLSSPAVLIDDIQGLEKYPDIQKELASLLDSMADSFFLAAYQTDAYDESGQKLLPMLYDRLCSRLSLRLEEPDLDVRLRFTQTCMEKMGLPENRNAALFLARHCLRLRHIRGVLEQVFLRYEQSNVLPSVDDISSLLSRAGAPQPVDCDSILAVVASRYGCTSSELRENTKDSRLTLPRQTAMYLCRELLGESYPSLGHIFGGKDHSTVMYAVRKIEKLKVTNKDINIQLTELTKQCRNALPKGEN